ncbi:MAG: DUF805 domain-containing protein [Bacteroidaceae bacterium]|nr:DUF805 domain-containing protein [Bacteroidaceae bacterium]
MTFTKSIKTCFSKYADFTGRATRSEYWWFYLYYLLLMLFSLIMIGSGKPMLIIGIIAALAWTASIIPYLAVTIRRLHDTDHSGWNLLLCVIPYIGSVWLLYVFFLNCKRSDPAENEYGPVPE